MRYAWGLLATALAGGVFIVANTLPTVHRCGAWMLWGSVTTALLLLPITVLVWHRRASDCAVLAPLAAGTLATAVGVSGGPSCAAPLWAAALLLLVGFAGATLALCLGWFYFCLIIR
jgi:hypothetical protein